MSTITCFTITFFALLEQAYLSSQ